MAEITDKLILDFIKRFYRPFELHAEFKKGFSAFHARDFRNPYCSGSLSAQAWDYGIEAAMHYWLVSAAAMSLLRRANRETITPQKCLTQ